MYFILLQRMDDTSSRPTWPRSNLFCLVFFLYICFVVCTFIIPDNIASGEWLSFAFTFSMMQMVEVSLFVRYEDLQHRLLLCISLLVASVLPSLQIFLVMQGEYSTQAQNICGYVYMFKELLIWFFCKTHLHKTSFLLKAYLLVVLWWIIMEIIFYSISEDMENEKNTAQKILCVTRLTPFFCTACFTCLRMTKGV